MKYIEVVLGGEAVKFVFPDEESTAGEEWYAEDAIPWYTAAADAAEYWLCGETCLVIGSPLFEAERLAARGLDVTYLDIRRPPKTNLKAVQGDAMAMPFADASFDAISSTCVLCHAGLGRYGDPVCPDGDRRILAEIARVLKPGGRGIVMFGPVMPGIKKTMTFGRVHRVYNERAAVGMVKDAGLSVHRSLVWCGGWLSDEWKQKWTEKTLDIILNDRGEVIQYCYLSVFFKKGS